MDSIGIHMLITIRNVPDPSIFDKITTVKPLLDIVIDKCKLNVVNEAGYQFEPIGATYVYVLSESHLSIHTYPEKNAAYIDIFCCNLDFDCAYAIETIKDLFKCQQIEYKVVRR